MNVRAYLLLLVLSVIAAVPASPQAQGFAGLGTQAEGFAVPERGVPLAFPRDHGAHPDYRIEWWYLTANLKSADGRSFGLQWTLFRSALEPGGKDASQIWMGHAAVTSAERHLVAERLARGGTGQAGVTLEPFSAWIDEWKMESRVSEEALAAGADPLTKLALGASGKDFRYLMELEAKGPLVLQGDHGYSVKSAEGQASYYYSQPFYTISGTLVLPEGEVAVTGEAWLDREWSSQPLSAGQTGWDWFSLHLGSGEKLMAFRLRGDGEGYISGTWIAADGRPTPLRSSDLVVTPLDTARVAGHTLPVRWRVEVPGHGVDVTTEALNDDAWMAVSFPYWEGPIRVSGSHEGAGYLEMTGYK
ncbi:MAG: lipocalin-like domain-containing protein [Rhizobiaceae bacterium]|nr:lipocalin-like domain-containing protein [Rhizobiaceae bacterium]